MSEGNIIYLPGTVFLLSGEDVEEQADRAVDQCLQKAINLYGPGDYIIRVHYLDSMGELVKGRERPAHARIYAVKELKPEVS
jgi:hypothetical protein